MPKLVIKKKWFNWLPAPFRYYELTEAVEHRLSSIFKCEAVLILNSGYTGNLAIFSSIPQKNDTILFDELAHASIKDGARLKSGKKI